MSVAGGTFGRVSRIGRAAAADAALTAALVAAGVVFAFTYDVYPAAGGGLIPVFLVGGVPLALVASLDLLGWRRITAARDPALRQQPAGGLISLAAAGLPLLLFGTLLIVIGFSGVYPDHRTAFASWTVSAVGYLLLAALGTQTVLLALTLLMRRNAPSVDPVSTPGTT